MGLCDQAVTYQGVRVYLLAAACFLWSSKKRNIILIYGLIIDLHFYINDNESTLLLLLCRSG